MSLFTEPPFGSRGRPSLALLVAITMLGTLAMHIFVPAMPVAAAELGASPTTMQLTLTVYLVGLAVGQLAYGPLSDRFGRRPTLLVGLVLFVAGMLLAIPAQSAGALIAARVLQAAGGCGALVLGRAIVRDAAREGRAAEELALLGVAMSLSPALSPAIGGFLASFVGWRAIFVCLALFGGAVLAVTVLTLPETHRERMPLPGLRALGAAYRELCRMPAFLAFAVGGAGATTSMYAFLSASPFLFVDVLRRPSSEIGLYYLLVVLGATGGGFAARFLARRVTVRHGARLGAIIAFASALALLAFDRSGNLTVATTVAPAVAFAFGSGLASPFALAGAMQAAPHMAGTASGLYGSLQMAVGALITLAVGLWHAPSALPSATIMLLCTAVSLLAFQRLR